MAHAVLRVKTAKNSTAPICVRWSFFARVALRASLDPEPGASASIIKPYSDEYGEAQYINYGGVLSHETDN